MLYQDGPALGERLSQVRGLQFDFHAFPGTPLCSWLNPTLANGIPRVLGRHHADAVLLQFGGAGSSPCAEGWPLAPVAPDEYHRGGQRLVTAAFEHAVRDLLQQGVRAVVVVGLPLRAPVLTTLTPRDAAMREALRKAVALLRDPRVRYLNLSSVLSDRNGHFTATLPCLPEELRTPGHCSGPMVAGRRSNVVRASDGLHLCDVPWPETGSAPPPGCPGYSSGAYRAAKAMAQPLLEMLSR